MFFSDLRVFLLFFLYFCTQNRKTMLEIRNLHARIGEKEILKGINLTIRDGETHAIMGPNGSGKSTLASVIAGRETFTVTSGEIIFKGVNITSLSPEERAWNGIFLGFQYPIEIPGVTNVNFIKTAVAEQRKQRGLHPLSAAEFLKLMRDKMAYVEMDSSFSGRGVNVGFSGGEKKRNEIFQMAMLEPDLAILDETDSGLDVDAVKTVSAGVKEFRKNGGSLLIITHSTRILDNLGVDKTHIIVDGKIVKEGGPELVSKINESGFEEYVKQ